MGIRASRTARPSRDLAVIRGFYEELVGLPVLFEFTDHDGFDGVVFGLPDDRAQLELVRAPDAEVAPLAGDDPTLNPYWPATGAVVVVDPDGYRLVLAVG